MGWQITSAEYLVAPIITTMLMWSSSWISPRGTLYTRFGRAGVTHQRTQNFQSYSTRLAFSSWDRVITPCGYWETRLPPVSWPRQPRFLHCRGQDQDWWRNRTLRVGSSPPVWEPGGNYSKQGVSIVSRKVSRNPLQSDILS